MKRGKLLAAILLLSLTAMTIYGCSGMRVPSFSSKRVSILTPYMSATTTKQMCNTMQKELEAKGIKADIIDTDNDYAKLASTIEDAVSKKTDAIIIVSVDPSQVKTQLQRAFGAEIPVFGCDSGYIDGMQVNATSDNYQMGKDMCEYLFDDVMKGKGTVVALTYRPHPGIAKRCVALDEELESHPDITLITEQQIDVPAGSIDSANEITKDLINKNPSKDSITAVWCAWDEAAIGATQALQDAGRDEVIVTGVDGSSQALKLISSGTNLKATMSQDFDGMVEIIVNDVTDLLNGEKIETGEKYAPAKMVTSADKS